MKKIINSKTIESLYIISLENLLVITFLIVSIVYHIIYGIIFLSIFFVLFNLLAYVSVIRDLDKYNFQEWKARNIYLIDWKNVKEKK